MPSESPGETRLPLEKKEQPCSLRVPRPMCIASPRPAPSPEARALASAQIQHREMSLITG